MVSILQTLLSLYALAPSKSPPSIMGELSSPFKPPTRPLRSPRLALGGTFPAKVFVFPGIALRGSGQLENFLSYIIAISKSLTLLLVHLLTLSSL